MAKKIGRVKYECVRPALFFLIMLMLSDYVILTLHAPSVVGAWREGAALLYILLMVLIAFFLCGYSLYASE